VYDLAKFLRLCAEANPNALEILFADPEDWLYETKEWRRLWQARGIFLSKQVQQTYLGYGLAQLKRIRSHRAWLLDPPQAKPTREGFGLPQTGTISRDDQNRIEENVSATVRRYRIDTVELSGVQRIALEEKLRAFWTDTLGPGQDADHGEVDDLLRSVAVRSMTLPSAVVASLEAERRYRAAMKQWEAYERWLRERNPARAELERRYGYDTKHAMHLLRLLRTGLELLETGELHVRRQDAADLLAVRRGQLSYDELLDHAAELEGRMAVAAAASSLPGRVDEGAIDALALELIAPAGQG
jgi:predicted nucleotidyltransferase